MLSVPPSKGNQPPIQPSLQLVVCALGITQIIAWGSLYYSIAVLAAPMAAELELSLASVFGAFSASLVVSGLVAPWVGRWIDRYGGRRIMGAGSLCATLALALIASAESASLFFLGWLLAGAAMSATLYDAAFPTLAQYAGGRYRGALTALTLFGGFASSVFWPLAWWLEAQYGWRLTLLSFALLQLLVCAPLHLAALRTLPSSPSETPRDSDSGASPAAQTSTVSQPGLVLLAVAFTLSAFVFSSIGAHGVGALNATGLSMEAAILAASLIGPMQVVGRVLELVFARHTPAVRVGNIAFATIAASLLLLWAAQGVGWLAFAFALAYGAANGVMTIVKGTVPAELFGRKNYGSLMGVLARPAFLAKAAAPLTVSVLIAGEGGYQNLPLPLFAVMLAGSVCFVIAVRRARAGGSRVGR